MPVAVVQEWLEEETDRSTTNYDALHERIMESGPIEGFLLHAAGFTGHGFRIFEVWETREQFDRFVAEQVMPLVAEVSGADATPPVITAYETHSLMTA